MRKPLPPGLGALLEVGVMFLPAIPAYLWVWPRLEGAAVQVMHWVSYSYVLAGTLVIGLRRWSLGQLGLNRHGLWLSALCGLAVLSGRLLIILAIDWGVASPRIELLSLLGDILFYFGAVGLVEELLYRGLVYRALEDWLNTTWAIWGSSLGFGLWHIFGQGPLMGAVSFFIGLYFALFRWRAGGILGLIFIHGLWDLESVLLIASSNQQILSIASQPDILRPGWLYLGTALLLLVPVYLWWLHPLAARLLLRRAG